MKKRIIPLLLMKDYRFFIFGQLVSNIGTWMQRIAQDWLVLQLSNNNAFALSLTIILQTLPVLLFGFWGGVVADQYPKRTILMLTQLLMGMVSVLLSVLYFADILQVWHVYILAFFTGVATVFDQPARQSLVIEVVGRENISDAVTMNSLVYNSSRFIGPALAGLAIGWLGTGFMFLLNGISYFFALVTLFAIRPIEKFMDISQQASETKGVKVGLIYIWNNVLLLLPIALIGTSSALSQTLPVMLPLFVKQEFGLSASYYGLLISAMAIGSLISVILTIIVKLDRTIVMVYAAVTLGILEIIVSIVQSYWICFFVLILAGSSILILNISANTILQTEVAPNLRGRVISIFLVVSLSASSLASLLIGIICQIAGPRIAMFITGGGVLFGTCFILLGLASRFKIPIRKILDLGGNSEKDYTN